MALKLNNAALIICLISYGPYDMGLRMRRRFIVRRLSKLEVLTLDAYRFSSDTGVDTFGIVGIARHYTFEGFVVADIMAHRVQIIVTNQKC